MVEHCRPNSLTQIVDKLMAPHSNFHPDTLKKECDKAGVTAGEMASLCAAEGKVGKAYCLLILQKPEIDLFGLVILRDATKVAGNNAWQAHTANTDRSQFCPDNPAYKYWAKEYERKAENLNALVETFNYLIDEHRYDYRGKSA
jgi:hypothetical protein